MKKIIQYIFYLFIVITCIGCRPKASSVSMRESIDSIPVIIDSCKIIEKPKIEPFVSFNDLPLVDSYRIDSLKAKGFHLYKSFDPQSFNGKISLNDSANIRYPFVAFRQDYQKTNLLVFINADECDKRVMFQRGDSHVESKITEEKLVTDASFYIYKKDVVIEICYFHPSGMPDQRIVTSITFKYKDEERTYYADDEIMNKLDISRLIHITESDLINQKYKYSRMAERRIFRFENKIRIITYSSQTGFYSQPEETINLPGEMDFYINYDL